MHTTIGSAMPLLAASVVLLAVMTENTSAEKVTKGGAQLPQVPSVALPQAQPPAPAPGYCVVVANKIAAEQAAHDREELQRLTVGVNARIADLEAKTAFLKDLQEKRQAFVAKAQDRLVQIYGKMQAEAAAAQLAAIDETVAAAIVMHLEAKQAGSVLAEMSAEKAARLSSLIAMLSELGSGAKSVGHKEVLR